MGVLRSFPKGVGDWRPEELPGLICSTMNDNSCLEMMQLLAMKAIKPKDVFRTYREQQERLWELNAADFLEIRPDHREADVRALHTFNAARAWHDATCGLLRLAPVLRP